MPLTRNDPFGQRGRAGRRLNGASVEADLDQETGDGAQPGAAYYAIEGGIPLRGEARLSGAKNAATKLLMASLLTEDACVLRNMPRGLGDLSITEEVLRALGAEITWIGDHTVNVRAHEIAETEVPMALGRKNRLAVLAAAPLLHRSGKAAIPAPGGDLIGPRPINFHLDGLQQMGAVIEARDNHYYFHTSGLRGTTIELPFPSVMATETLLIAATLARGVTIIQNAAIEPEIIDLIKFLQKMGAIIEQRVDRKIVIEGVERLRGAEYRAPYDRNEAVSLAIAAYLTHGDIR